MFCRQCGVESRLPELQRVADRAHARARIGRAPLPLLQLQQAGAEGVRAVRRALHGTGRLWHRAGRGRDSRGVSRARGSRALDRDTVRRKGSLVEMLERVAKREIDVLIGTQMIAKGHDFPDVTLVGVISADVGLGLADFRAAERTFQLLTQVAGRAGRGERPGQAIIQSLVPEHYSMRLAASQDYRAFYEKEMEFRRAMRYPPQVAMVNVVVRGRTFAEAIDGARELADAARGGKGYVVLGPAPAPLTSCAASTARSFS